MPRSPSLLRPLLSALVATSAILTAWDAAGETPAPPNPLLAGGIVVPLYPPGSPYLKADRIGEPEQFNMTKGVPGRVQNVVNIHNPSIEFHPADPVVNTGATVILAAGGAHQALNVGTESGDLVPYFYNYGVNTVILRNRLRGDGYDVATDAVRDALQAIRVVRSRAREWGIDSRKIGIMGFSAGAELAAATALEFTDFNEKNKTPNDPLSTVSSRPDFVALLYPGPTPFSRPTGAKVPQNPVPSFVASAGSGDRGHAIWAMDFVMAMIKEGVPNVELHIYGNGVHANGLKDREGIPFGTWQSRFIDWFRDLGFLQKPGIETRAAREAAAFTGRPTRK